MLFLSPDPYTDNDLTEIFHIWIYHSAKSAATYFWFSSCIIWHMPAFSRCFPFLGMASWQTSFHWDHFCLGFGKQTDPQEGPDAYLRSSVRPFLVFFFLFPKDMTFRYGPSVSFLKYTLNTMLRNAKFSANSFLWITLVMKLCYLKSEQIMCFWGRLLVTISNCFFAKIFCLGATVVTSLN